MTPQDIAEVQAYLRKRFSNSRIVLVPRPKNVSERPDWIAKLAVPFAQLPWAAAAQPPSFAHCTEMTMTLSAPSSPTPKLLPAPKLFMDPKTPEVEVKVRPMSARAGTGTRHMRGC